jgi:hypothetical protein
VNASNPPAEAPTPTTRKELADPLRLEVSLADFIGRVLALAFCARDFCFEAIRAGLLFMRGVLAGSDSIPQFRIPPWTLEFPRASQEAVCTPPKATSIRIFDQSRRTTNIRGIALIRADINVLDYMLTRGGANGKVHIVWQPNRFHCEWPRK